jgi:putative toxin-antitoxin system antitoxin component (TIGR02293 family)
MSALAPFLEPDAAWHPSLVEEAPPVKGPAWLSDSASMEREIAQRNMLLAKSSEIPDDLQFFVDDLADQLIDLPETASLRVDPYLLMTAQRALLGSLRALSIDDVSLAREQVRVRLEQLRQVYRDLAEGEAVYEDRSAKKVAAWLADVLDVPQARLAELLGVSPRTFQRWISEKNAAAPDGEDARRIRVVARIANHLRHVLTGPGVVHWFESPNSQLQTARPLDLLDDPDAAARLTTLAASARSHTAA